LVEPLRLFHPTSDDDRVFGTFINVYIGTRNWVTKVQSVIAGQARCAPFGYPPDITAQSLPLS
jgi:hypothetical protein